MTTKYRFRDKYRIQLREKDHPPPHVHPTGGGVDVMLSLETIEVMIGKARPLIIKEAQASSVGCAGTVRFSIETDFY
ncbi:DUF4160 domain-containing protein [Pseudomonas sp. MG-9]|uniref:DUF4160 domain-containing protein n=1 Tax=Pseudomonas sp. MG-9 TaxID=2839032 RepID=UPI002078C5D7|nr:DUF4160 domain-containing protein [Pseudomonas sp. MG-9]